MEPIGIATGRAAAVTALVLLSACSGTSSTRVAEMTAQDKEMDCERLQIEIAEAEFLKARAEKNRGPRLKHIVMPLSYPSTYMSASKAEDSADTRMAYLSRLYEVKSCEHKQQYVQQAPANTVPTDGYAQLSPPYYAPGYHPMHYAY